MRGPPDNRYWRVKWAGKDENDNDRWPDRGAGNGKVELGWIVERHLSVGCVDMQNAFWRSHRDLDRRSDVRGEDCGAPDELRCPQCNQILASAAALKRHMAEPTKKNRFTCKKRPRIRKFKGTEVDKVVKKAKREALLKDLMKIDMEGNQLKWALAVEYLGHMF